MCAVSMVVDNYRNRFPNPNEWQVLHPVEWPNPSGTITVPAMTIEDVRKEIEAARKKDREEGNPDCSSDEKAEWLKKFDEVCERLDNLQMQINDHETLGHPNYRPEDTKVT